MIVSRETVPVIGDRSSVNAVELNHEITRLSCDPDYRSPMTDHPDHRSPIIAQQFFKEAVKLFLGVVVKKDLSRGSPCTNLYFSLKMLLEPSLSILQIRVFYLAGWWLGLWLGENFANAGFRLPDGQAFVRDRTGQAKLFALREREKGASMAHGELVSNDHTLNRLWQLKQTQGVGYCDAAACDSVGNLFLRESELAVHHLISSSLFDRVKVVTLEVLNQGQFHHLPVGDILDDGWNALDTGPLRGSPATFAGDDLVATFCRANDDWLEYPLAFHRSSQFFEFLGIEDDARLERIGSDQLNVQLSK